MWGLRICVQCARKGMGETGDGPFQLDEERDGELRMRACVETGGGGGIQIACWTYARSNTMAPGDAARASRLGAHAQRELENLVQSTSFYFGLSLDSVTQPWTPLVCTVTRWGKSRRV